MLRAFGCAVLTLSLLAGTVAAEKKEQPGKDSGQGDKGTKAGLLPIELARFLKDHDRNKDGFLDRDEFPEDLRYAFTRLDLDKDGKISAQELVRGNVYLQARRRASDIVFILVEMSDCDECCAGELQAIYDAVRKVDANHDGKVDADELKSARERFANARVDYILKVMDEDKDGKISRDEARGLVRENFAKLDRNKDGFIERQELLRAASEREPVPGVKPGDGKTGAERSGER